MKEIEIMSEARQILIRCLWILYMKVVYFFYPKKKLILAREVSLNLKKIELK
jgi:hypothetical protein